MINEIQIFLNEINSILAEIVGAQTISAFDFESRISQLFVTWNRILKPGLKLAGVQSELIKELDRQLEFAVRLSSKRIKKAPFSVLLKNIRKIINIIIFEVARSSVPVAPVSQKTEVSRVFDEIPDLPDEFIPNSLLGWKSKIKDFLKKSPFDQNVFVMIRYADQTSKLLESVKQSINNFDVGGRKMNPIVAKENKISDDLYNPIACLLCCRYGVAVFDSVSAKPKFNPNVAYELGMMHFLKRECLILKDTKIKSMPSDILHKIYEPFKTLPEAEKSIDNWLRGIIN